MSIIDSLFNCTPCSKKKLCRTFLILGTLSLIYLFMYKNEFSSASTFAENILAPLIRFDSSKSDIVTIVPVIKSTRTITTVLNTTTIRRTSIPITTNTDASTTIQINKTEQVININTNSTNASNITDEKSILKQPKEAFVTFSNNEPSYLAVLKVLLDSVHAFSTRPIIAFGIGVDLNIDEKEYPRVIKRRIEQSDCGPVRLIFVYPSLLRHFCCLFTIF